jgi:hypothetical protein
MRPRRVSKHEIAIGNRSSWSGRERQKYILHVHVTERKRSLHNAILQVGLIDPAVMETYIISIATIWLFAKANSVSQAPVKNWLLTSELRGARAPLSAAKITKR